MKIVNVSPGATIKGVTVSVATPDVDGGGGGTGAGAGVGVGVGVGSDFLRALVDKGADKTKAMTNSPMIPNLFISYILIASAWQYIVRP